MGSKNSAFFVDLETHKDSSMLVKSLDSAFARAMEIDFEDIWVEIMKNSNPDNGK